MLTSIPYSELVIAPKSSESIPYGVGMKTFDVGASYFDVMKTCTKCGVEKQELDFYRSEFLRIKGRCKSCQLTDIHKRYAKRNYGNGVIENLDGELWVSLGHDKTKSAAEKFISNKGRVKKRLVDREKIIVPWSWDGYPAINVHGRIQSIHRLVATVFIPNPHNFNYVNHINAVITDNRVENLEWCTQSHNCKHTFAINRRSHKGHKHPQTTLSLEDVITIRRLLENPNASQTQIATLYGVTKHAIYKIKHGKTWCYPEYYPK